MQLGLDFLAVVVVVQLLWPRAWSGILVSSILAFLWGWLAIGYHLLFLSRINPLAFGFAALSGAGALAFWWYGAVRGRVRIERARGLRGWLGGVLVVYALLLYPALSYLVGHRYPASPTFGLPCPTTIFTLGVLAFVVRPIRGYSSRLRSCGHSWADRLRSCSASPRISGCSQRGRLASS